MPYPTIHGEGRFLIFLDHASNICVKLLYNVQQSGWASDHAQTIKDELSGQGVECLFDVNISHHNRSVGIPSNLLDPAKGEDRHRGGSGPAKSILAVGEVGVGQSVDSLGDGPSQDFACYLQYKYSPLIVAVGRYAFPLI